LNNIRAAYESRNIILTHRGALGILSNDSRDVTGSVLPLYPESKRELQEEYRKYGLTGNQWQVILTNLSLKWQQMSIDPDKLGLYQEVREDTIKICDSFGFPFELLGNEKGVTFENQKWAERRLYENTIIPEAQEWIDAMNATLETEKRSWHIVGRFDHLPIFNENLKERAASISLMTNALSRQYADQAITLQQYQTELGKYKIGEL
jgi:phage portal protein BeeE